MKQKYSIVKDDETKKLIIREYGELDKDIMSLLCEEQFDDDHVANALENGRVSLVSALRTNNMYPPGIYAERIAEAVTAMYGPGGEPSMDLIFDDKEFLTRYQEEMDAFDDIKDDDVDMEDSDSDELDDLLDDDSLDIKSGKSSLKIADDDSPNVEEDA